MNWWPRPEWLSAAMGAVQRWPSFDVEIDDARVAGGTDVALGPRHVDAPAAVDCHCGVGVRAELRARCRLVERRDARDGHRVRKALSAVRRLGDENRIRLRGAHELAPGDVDGAGARIDGRHRTLIDLSAVADRGRPAEGGAAVERPRKHDLRAPFHRLARLVFVVIVIVVVAIAPAIAVPVVVAVAAPVAVSAVPIVVVVAVLVAAVIVVVRIVRAGGGRCRRRADEDRIHHVHRSGGDRFRLTWNLARRPTEVSSADLCRDRCLVRGPCLCPRPCLCRGRRRRAPCRRCFCRAECPRPPTVCQGIEWRCRRRSLKYRDTGSDRRLRGCCCRCSGRRRPFRRRCWRD